jgi:LPXTG-motif cell wall-anchored protein
MVAHVPGIPSDTTLVERGSSGATADDDDDRLPDTGAPGGMGPLAGAVLLLLGAGALLLVVGRRRWLVGRATVKGGEHDAGAREMDSSRT